MKQERLWKLGLKTQAGETTGAYILSFNNRRAINIPDNPRRWRKNAENRLYCSRSWRASSGLLVSLRCTEKGADERGFTRLSRGGD
jgi:hypothetical protein